MCVCYYLVDAEDGCVKLLRQVMQSGRDIQYLSRPLRPIVSSKLGPEQRRYRVHNKETDQTTSHQEGDTLGQAHLQGRLRTQEDRRLTQEVDRRGQT